MKRQRSMYGAMGACSAALLLIGASAQHASAAVSVRTTAVVIGSTVQGEISTLNRGTSTTSVASISSALEVQMPAGTSPALPAGSQRGYWRVAQIDVAVPSPIGPRATVRIPYSADLCASGEMLGARSFRIATAVSDGSRTARGKSRRLAPPPGLACAECGNGAVETGEQCDGGACCTATCQIASDATACDDGNACTASDACTAGACAGAPLSCNDGDACSTDACDVDAGCTHEPILGCGDNCDANACNTCKGSCSGDAEACQASCWESFLQCLNGCTSIYCAPFCQVDLGRCYEFCPPSTCQAACEADNGCGPGCTQS